MKNIAAKLADKIYRENPQYTELQMLQMRYGIECFLHEFVKTVVFLLLFSAFSLFGEYLLVFAVLFVLRPFTGGYHARTNRGCYFISFLFFLIVISGGRIFEPGLLLKSAILAVSVFAAIMLAPVEHRNKVTRDEATRRKFKVIAVIAVFIAGAAGYFLPGSFSGTAFFAILCNTFMMAMGHWDFKKNPGEASQCF